jgi:glucose-6-phosphate 1-dehydrogenase
LHQLLDAGHDTVSSEGLAAAWRTLAPLLDHRPEVLPYAQGSWGPEAAQELPGPDGWHLQHGGAIRE